MLRRWLTAWVEAQLAVATSPRSVAWLVALRNFSRLIVPAVGAGLLFAALNPADLAAQTANPALFDLPDFVLALIWRGLARQQPLRAAAARPIRLVPLDDADARARRLRLTLVFGVVLALASAARGATAPLEMPPADARDALLPADPARRRSASGAPRRSWPDRRRTSRASLRGRPDRALGTVRLRFLQLLGRVLRLVAVVAPVLAAARLFRGGARS